MKTILFFSFFTLVITEILGLFNALNYLGLLFCWTIIDVILIYLLIKKNSFSVINVIKNKLIISVRTLNKLEKFIFGFTIIIFLGVFFQGLIYPTNNWDSMAYHMPRIIHWIQNENLAHYRTSIYPQLNSPPFAEQIILNINLLLGNDYFSNSVQLFYLLATGIVASLIAKKIGLNRVIQILSFFIVLTLPESILLASSTHNELVMSFFVLSSIYFFMITIQQTTTINFLLLGFSIGLALATKAPAYIFLTVFVFMWAGYQLYLIVTQQKLKILNYLIVLFSVVLINSGHYYRNYQLTENLFGLNEDIKNKYVNEEHSLLMLVSNMSKNILSQFGLPKIAPIAYHAAEKFHKTIGVDLHNPKTTFESYSIDPLAIHENNGANPYYMLLLLVSMWWMIFTVKKRNKMLVIFWIGILLTFLLFCFYLKWEPWVKAHVTFFILYAIVLAAFLESLLKYKMIFSVIIVGFIGFATLTMTFNYSRPYITLPPFTSVIKISDNRYQKYFSRFLEFYPDYKTVHQEINKKKYKNIGLMLNSYDMEYPLFINSYRNDVKPIHINASELSDELPIQSEVDCIVSTNYLDSIVFKNQVFYNAMKGNDRYLYLFLKK